MKKAISVLILVIVVGAAYFLFFKKGEKRDEGPKQQPLTLDDNTGAFNQSYNTLLTAYDGLKDALVASDTTKASAAARELRVAADSLKVSEIHGDSTGAIKETAKVYASTISSSAHALSLEANITAKRKEFEMIADALYNLTRTVRYDGQKLYWQFCPMAFNNKGAYWISNEREIRNPYFGNEMLECGSVEDSLDYSKK
jgi:Cu(I)/Ag(I) efflux system membrane fusion protein